MKKITFILIMVIASYSLLTAQWINQLTTGNGYSFVSMKILNNTTGYLLSSRKIKADTNCYFYKTTNGGISWFIQAIPQFMNMFLHGMDFINANTGYVLGTNYWISTDNHIFKTTNGGITWADIIGPPVSVQTIHSAIKFINEGTGYVGGRFGTLVKTTDAGLNWFSVDTINFYINDLCFLNENTGFCICANSYVCKTTDAGANFSFTKLYDTTTSHLDYDLNRIKFVNNSTGYITGDRSNPYWSAVFKTTNAGASWKSILVLPDYWYAKALEVIGDSVVYVGLEAGEILKSTNSGRTWLSMILPSANIGQHFIYFKDYNTGFSNVAEKLYRTTNGGVFIKNISTEAPDKSILYQNYPNPFNPETKIKYSVKQTVYVKLSVFKISGEIVTSPVNEVQRPGTYEVSFDGSRLASGIYFCNLYIDGKKAGVKKMLLIK